MANANQDHNQRPRKLKDFLTENSPPCTSSCSSSSHGRFISNSYRSKAIVQAVLNVMKSIHFSSAIKSPAFLPRSFSGRLLKNREERGDHEVKVTAVRVKDILRWTSFRDSAEEIMATANATSPHHYTTTTTCISRSTSSGSNSSSWSESDFTSEFSPSWNGENNVDVGKSDLLHVGCMEEEPIEEEVCLDQKLELGLFLEECLSGPHVNRPEEVYGRIKWGVEDTKEACVREMDSSSRAWKLNKFEDEPEEIGVEIENGVLGFLVDELLIELYGC